MKEKKTKVSEFSPLEANVRFCGCTADSKGNVGGAIFQDQRYGRGKRVVTSSGKEGIGKVKCTVCGKTFEQGKK
jgi:hypothetical protein